MKHWSTSYRWNNVRGYIDNNYAEQARNNGLRPLYMHNTSQWYEHQIYDNLFPTACPMTTTIQNMDIDFYSYHCKMINLEILFSARQEDITKCHTEIKDIKPTPVRCCYNAVRFLQNSHDRHLSVVSMKSDLCSVAVIAVSYVISWWIGPHHNGTRLYFYVSDLIFVARI